MFEKNYGLFYVLYFQNLNSDFTDSALGSTEKSPLPYGNFHLREQTMASILTNPKYQPHGGSELGTNAFTYLKFGLPSCRLSPQFSLL